MPGWVNGMEKKASAGHVPNGLACIEEALALG